MAESRRLTETLLDGQDRVRDGWRVVGWIVLAEALEYVTGMAYGLVPAAHRPPLLDPWIGWATYLVATGLCLRLEGVPFASVGFRLDRRWCRDLGLGTLAGGAIMGACALAIAALGGFRWIRTPGFHPASLATGAFLYLGVALAEETYYRGYAFQRLVRGSGVIPAQILFALLFAYGHWDNPGMHGTTQAWATLNIGLAALLLGLAWIRTGSLALPIGLHLGWNWTQGNLLGFGVSGTSDGPGLLTPIFQGRPAWLTGGAFGLEASLPCALVCGLAILLLARWKGRPAQVPPSA